MIRLKTASATARPAKQKRALNVRLAVLATAVLVGGCVASGPNSPRDLASVLTPQEADSVAAADGNAGSLSLAPNGETPTANSVLSPAPKPKADTKTALVDPSAKKAPAVEAVEAVAAPKKSSTTPKPNPETSASPKPSTPDDKDAAEATPKTDASPEPKRTTRRPRIQTAHSEDRGAAFSRPRSNTPRKNIFGFSSSKPKSGEAQTKKRPTLIATKRGGSSLPGVRGKSIFGIDDAVEVEEFDQPVKVAGVTNLARRGTHGLLLQRPDVKVGCFPPRLVRILKNVERRFGRTPIVTSGYRSTSYNRLVRGARNSTHTRCMAADIQVQGISKWTLAKYLRSVEGRGGVGTYCHTKSVHIDIGSKRAWHHCRRSRSKRRRS